MLLPQVVAFLEGTARDAMLRVARALGADRAAAGLHELARRIGAPLALKDIGLAEADLDAAVDLVAEHTRADRPDVQRILRAAFDGVRPG